MDNIQLDKLHLDKLHLDHISIVAMIMIWIGITMVVYDLSRIFRYWLYRKWTAATGTVLSIVNVGGFHTSVTFTYTGYEGYTRKYKASQTLARDTWAQSLKTGSHVPVRYNPNDPSSGLIDHQQVWKHSIVGSVNSLWILLGIAILLIHRQF